MCQQIEPPIIPSPQIVKILEGKFVFSKNVFINFNIKNDDQNLYSLELLQRTLKKYLKINSTISDANGQIQIEQVEKESQLFKDVPTDFIEEAYSLEINSKNILLKAITQKGIFYAAMSLIQLMEKSNENFLPCLTIIDWPDMKIRGISDDISRGQVSNVDNFKRIIDHLARYKMNTYMPYIEDMIEFDKFPEIGKGRGALTKKEIKEIVDYAKKNFIEVIPIFQTLGHYENILSLPPFIKYAEFKGAASLCVSYDSTYIFLEDLLKEVFEIFPSKYINIGADESYDVGLGKSKYLVDKSSLAKVHAEHYKKVYEICKKYGKKVLIYGDIILNHPEILEMIPKDIIIVDWHYRPDNDYPSTKTIKEAGFNYFVSPSVWNFVTSFPINSLAIPNIKYLIKAGLENSASGMINSNWGDYGAETFKELVLFGYAWSAQCSWNYNKSEIDIFSKNYFCDFFGADIPETKNLYEIFSNTFNGIYWHEVWRHPLLPFRETVWWESKVSPVCKIEWIELSMKNAEENIKIIEKLATKNKEHLEIFKWLINFNLWYKTKLETQLELEKWKQVPVPTNNEKILQLINLNISSLSELKKQYKFIWLKYYKIENLNMIEDKFNRLISYFNETKHEIEKLSNLDQMTLIQPLSSPVISSDWIYLKENDTAYAKKAEFICEINLDNIPSNATVQLIGDGYTRLYINDKFVDEVFVRRSLSLWTEYKRIKMIDITKYFKPGKNVFFVEVENFGTSRAAGFNLTSNFGIDDITFETKSQENIKHFVWKGRVPNSDEWKDVSVKEYPFPVIAPDFFTKRSSWIER